MPDPKSFSDQNDWMDACMHTQVKGEGKPQQQSVAICLSMWKNRNKKKDKKKCAAEYVRELAHRLMPAETSC